MKGEGRGIGIVKAAKRNYSSFTFSFVILLLFISGSVTGGLPNLRFKNLNAKYGLSHSWIISQHQDSYGFMWFGTYNGGINKFDGYSITVYEYDPKKINSLKSNRINAFLETSDSVLFVGTQSGISVYNRDKDHFMPFPLLTNEIITDLIELEDKKLLVAGTEQLYLIDREKQSVFSLCHGINNACDAGYFLTHILKDNFGNLWIGTTKGLYKIDVKDWKLTHYKHRENDPNSLAGDIVTGIGLDKTGRLWVGTRYNGISIMKYNSRQGNIEIEGFTHIKHEQNNERSLSEGEIKAIFQDREGNVWISTQNGGLNILTRDNLLKEKYIFTHYVHNSTNPESLSSNTVYSIFDDDNGIVWMGTYNGGVSYYHKQIYKFDHIKPIQGEKEGLNDNFINVFLEDGNDLLIGTERGLNIFNRTTGKFTHYTHTEYDYGLSSNAIWELFKDSKGNIWIGTWAGGLNLFDRKTNTFTHFYHEDDNPNSLMSNNVYNIVEDDEGMLWIACMNGGLSRFDYQTNTFLSYHHQKDNKETLSDPWVRTLLFNSYGELWISTSIDVEVFNKKKETFKSFVNDEFNASSISYNGAIIFYEDSKRNIWIGTGSGLNVFNRNDSTFTVYMESDGLPNNTINGILEDDHENLWISTNKGISKFVNGVNKPTDPQFKNFDVNDGLQSNEFNRRSCLRTEDGMMFFGGNNGFNMFHPDSIEENTYIPKIILTNFFLFNKKIDPDAEGSPLQKQVNSSDKIILKYDQSVFSIEFSALSYLSPEKNRFRYKLMGFDKEWIYAKDNRTATYTNLDPGEYMFSVDVSNSDGIWGGAPKELKIIIKPPLWGTWYFKTGMILILISLILLAYYLRFRIIQRQKIELEIQVKEKTRDLSKINQELKQFAYIVSHDLKAPLRGISNLTEWIEEDLSEIAKGEVKENLALLKNRVKRMQDLINGILNYSRVGRSNTELELIDTGKIAEEVIALLDTKGFKISVAEDMPEVMFNKVRMEQIFTNLISNAIKYHHKNEGNIDISCTSDEHYYIFSVEDDGPGISPDFHEKIFMIFQTLQSKDKSDSTGIGLTIVKKIIEEQGGAIWVESDGEKGSRFVFTIQK